MSRVSDTQDEVRNRGALLATRNGESATTGSKTATQGTIINSSDVMFSAQFLKYNEGHTYPFKKKNANKKSNALTSEINGSVILKVVETSTFSPVFSET